MSEREISITAGETVVVASLNDTTTASLIWNALPIQASANLWGDEIYFSIPVTTAEEPGQDVVDLGDLAYWPPGGAFYMFFGRTPASRGDEIRPASSVTVVGQMRGELDELKNVPAGAPVLIEPLST